ILRMRAKLRFRTALGPRPSQRHGEGDINATILADEEATGSKMRILKELARPAHWTEWNVMTFEQLYPVRQRPFTNPLRERTRDDVSPRAARSVASKVRSGQLVEFKRGDQTFPEYVLYSGDRDVLCVCRFE